LPWSNAKVKKVELYFCNLVIPSFADRQNFNFQFYEKKCYTTLCMDCSRVITKTMNEQVSIMLMLSTCTQKAPSLNLNQDTDYPVWGLCGLLGACRQMLM
jgi:hypothetical protein